MKKLIISVLFLPLVGYANQVNLDKLVSNNDNFCNQGQEGQLTGVLSYFDLNSNSDILFKGLRVSRIEIQKPMVQIQFTPDKLKEESKQYLKPFKSYNYKNLYTINHMISLIIDSDINNVKTKLDNFNGRTAYKKFGQYNPELLKQSKTPEEFEFNLRKIQVPEYNVSIVNNYEIGTQRTSLIYQCKIISYTSDDLTTIVNKVSR